LESIAYFYASANVVPELECSCVHACIHACVGFWTSIFSKIPWIFVDGIWPNFYH